MNAVMLSVRPKWCDMIASGKKTVEIRKSRPTAFLAGNGMNAFKCYVYETRGARDTPVADEDGHLDFHGRGQVIGEFICHRIIHTVMVGTSRRDMRYNLPSTVLAASCLSYEELVEYGKGAALYGWHLSELKIYDQPRNLSEFSSASSLLIFENTPNGSRLIWSGMTRAPQSWCYVAEAGT